LERSYVWRNYDVRGLLLSRGGKVDLHGPSGFRKEKFVEYLCLGPVI
jgi:hypothetical protein